MGPKFATSARSSAPARLLARGISAVFAAACALSGTHAAAQAQQADARATMVGPASVYKDADMNFGTVGTLGVGGTVTIEPLATNSCLETGDLVRISGPCTPATFTVTGRRNMLVRIRNRSGNTITLTGPGGATMNVNLIVIGVSGMILSPGGGNPSGMLGRYRITDAGGTGQFRLGGTLTVGPNQTPGVYSGELLIQVQYN